jgi:hypothetical protein
LPVRVQGRVQALRGLATEWLEQLKVEEDQIAAATGLLTLQVSGIAPDETRNAVQTWSRTESPLDIKTLVSSILPARYVGYLQFHTKKLHGCTVEQDSKCIMRAGKSVHLRTAKASGELNDAMKDLLTYQVRLHLPFRA